MEAHRLRQMHQRQHPIAYHIAFTPVNTLSPTLNSAAAPDCLPVASVALAAASAVFATSTNRFLR